MQVPQPIEQPAGANMPSKDELLRRAKDAIGASDQSLHEAADALGDARALHNASQAEMARAVGKSEAWVSLLLRWRRAGYPGESPFGPTTKAGRLKHDKDRRAAGVSKPGKPRKTNAAAQADTADDAQMTADKRKNEYAIEEDEAAAAPSLQGLTSRTEHQVEADDGEAHAGKREPKYKRREVEPGPAAPTSAERSTHHGSPAWAKDNLQFAIDRYWPLLDDAGKSEMKAYFLKKTGVRVAS